MTGQSATHATARSSAARPRTAPLDAATRERVIALLHERRPRNEIARLAGCSAGSVTNIARAEGIAFDRSAAAEALTAKQAHAAARRDYDAAGRLALVNRGLVVADRLLVGVAGVRELHTWATALGILIDKHRLEAGEPTARTEVTTDGVRDRLAGRLAQLTAGDDAHGTADGVH